MSLHDDMAESHARDYRRHRRMMDLVHEVEDFLAAPPSRCHEQTLVKLRIAVDEVRRECAHIVAVWD